MATVSTARTISPWGTWKPDANSWANQAGTRLNALTITNSDISSVNFTSGNLVFGINLTGYPVASPLILTNTASGTVAPWSTFAQIYPAIGTVDLSNTSPGVVMAGSAFDIVVGSEVEQTATPDILMPDPLEGFSEYEQPGWDGDDAKPISGLAISVAREAALTLESSGLPSPAIAPSADGSIGFEWWNESACVYVDFGPESRVQTYINLNDGTPSERDSFWWTGENSARYLARLLERLYHTQPVILAKPLRRSRPLTLRVAA
ncbi:MAG TPA: hypothetical protein VMD53_18305 [Rhizomicrobium sp.]|nr:hypothetical protein [Rhizomicrobium sp.]